MNSQAKSVGRSGELAALRKEYESKAQQVLTEMVSNSTSGTLDIFTLFRLITKRMPLEALPNKKLLSAGGASPDAEFFVQALKNFEDLRSDIKKLLKSPILKGCLQKTARSQDCEEDFHRLKEGCKLIRHTIIGKLQMYDIASTKDFVILECLTRLVQICHERQEPPAVVKSMILIWQLLQDCQLTQRFVSYKHVSEIIDRLCTLCERGADTDTQRGSQSPQMRRPPMTVADRDTQTIRSIERLVAPEHLPEAAKDLGDRIKTISRRFREFSSPQQKPTTVLSPPVDRSRSSQINLNLSRRFEEVNDGKEQVSVNSRLRSRSRLLDSPEHPDALDRSGAVSDLGSHENSRQNIKGNFGLRSNTKVRRSDKIGEATGQVPSQRKQPLFAGVDDTFLSEVSGSSISFRDLASGSKRSHRVFKESAQKSTQPADQGHQVAVDTFYPPSDDPEEQMDNVAGSSPPRHEYPTFGSQNHTILRPGSASVRGGVVGRHEASPPRGLADLSGESAGRDRVVSRADTRRLADLSRREDEVDPEEDWGFGSRFSRGQVPQDYERWDGLPLREKMPQIPLSRRVSESTEDRYRSARPQEAFVNEIAGNLGLKSGAKVVEVDSIVRELAREILTQKIQEMLLPSSASIRAKIVEAQIFSVSWDDELLYDQIFEKASEGVDYCTNHSRAALSLVQDGFDLDTIMKFSELSHKIASSKEHMRNYLGKRPQDTNFPGSPEVIINPHRFSAPVDNPWSEFEKEQLFDGFDGKRLNFHFNSRSHTEKSSREGSNSKKFRKNG